MIEPIVWRRTTDHKPDTDRDVLVRLNSKSPRKVWLGFVDPADKSWRYECGMPIKIPPTHWAEMPKGPEA